MISFLLTGYGLKGTLEPCFGTSSDLARTPITYYFKKIN
jgi:hypothetical protein